MQVTAQVRSVAFSLDGALLATGSDALCDYNGETTPPNNLVLRAEEKNHVSGTEW